MDATTTTPLASRERLSGQAGDYTDARPSVASAVSWGAIVAGAAAGASLSLILLILGVGLGLSSISPWAREGISAASFGVSTIVWLTLTQLLSSAMGGYLAGRLRTKWIGAQMDEVYFRDTAHGFLSWAVASLTTAALLSSAIGSILSGGIQAGASVVGGVANTATMAASGMAASSDESGPMAYFVDSLFRRNGSTEATGSTEAAEPTAVTGPTEPIEPTAVTEPTEATGPGMPAEASERTTSREAAEVGRIFMNVSRSEPLPPEDLRYVGQLVAERTGVSQQEGEKRVSDVYARAQAKLRNAEVAAKEAADKARKASAYAALWMFVSLLIGAFVASVAAIYGGRQRDA